MVKTSFETCMNGVQQVCSVTLSPGSPLCPSVTAARSRQPHPLVLCLAGSVRLPLPGDLSVRQVTE